MIAGTGRPVRYGAALCAAAFALLAALPAAADYDEYKVKAAFLLNFARLVEWPDTQRPAPGEPLVVGVHGNGDAADAVARALEGTAVDQNPVDVRPLASPGQLRGCHILFVAGVDGASAWLDAARAHSVLSVGESEGFAAHGGVVNFFVEDKKLRFEINQQAADRSGLKISSRLLRLARLVPHAP